MNKKITLLCPAKINLSLDVTGKRPDNYHTLDSIFQTVSVYDTLEITLADGEGISLECDNPAVPCDESNLAYKAVKAFLHYAGIQAKISIRLEKHIPSGAGMGGGSADAAGVLYALNLLTEKNYSNPELREIGVNLGADVPFLLLGGTARAQGIGEVLTSLRPLPEIPLVILKGTESISTPEAYKAIDSLLSPVHPDTSAMLKAVQNQDVELLCQNCANLFEAVTECQDVSRAEKVLLEHGAQCAVMTGSGAAVFGIFKDSMTAKACAENLRHDFAFVQACHMTKQAFQVI
ncbi:MAG: 4-(cytidine 5'-diphospho)-2-C-methyl-D-erythritol kinase [Oscillospiraceae bacterium]|nr:4-(cytidine 5'-diphospho)-2-C-methyl-D-erythritol kinase [Oscillospiraceae bacterium]